MIINRYEFMGKKYINFTEIVKQVAWNNTWKGTSFYKVLMEKVERFREYQQLSMGIFTSNVQDNFLTVENFYRVLNTYDYFGLLEVNLEFRDIKSSIKLVEDDAYGGHVYCIYRFLDKYDDILYVGSSVDIKRRLQRHNHLDKECYISTVKIEISTFESDADMYLYEVYCINKYKPPYNKGTRGGGELSYILPELSWELWEGGSFLTK